MTGEGAASGLSSSSRLASEKVRSAGFLKEAGGSNEKMLVLMAALMMSLAFSGEPASAANRGLKGLWIIKYYTKNGVQIARQCVPFAQTNNISGFRKWSGTWGVVSTNIAGQWVQKGDDLAWYGASGKEAFWAVGDKISKREIAGAYGRFKTTNSATVQVGGWTGNKTDRCTG